MTMAFSLRKRPWQGRKARKEERQGRKVGKKGKEGKKEGRKEGTEGRKTYKEGRKEGRKEDSHEAMLGLGQGAQCTKNSWTVTGSLHSTDMN